MRAITFSIYNNSASEWGQAFQTELRTYQWTPEELSIIPDSWNTPLILIGADEATITTLAKRRGPLLPIVQQGQATIATFFLERTTRACWTCWQQQQGFFGTRAIQPVTLEQLNIKQLVQGINHLFNHPTDHLVQLTTNRMRSYRTLRNPTCLECSTYATYPTEQLQQAIPAH